MAVFSFGAHTPELHETAYVAEGASVIGKVVLKKNSSIWFGATLRGDNEPIVIGENSNVQESAVLHTDMGSPLTLGANVTVGHQAMLHGCTVGDGSLIGIQAVVLNNAVIGKDCLIGACALVTSGTVIPDRSMVVGSPAKVIRSLTDDEIARMQKGTESYVSRAAAFRKDLKRID